MIFKFLGTTWNMYKPLQILAILWSMVSIILPFTAASWGLYGWGLYTLNFIILISIQDSMYAKLDKGVKRTDA